jgi:hypothetical protein
LIANS